MWKVRLANLDHLLNGEKHLVDIKEVGWTGTLEDLRGYLYQRAKVRGLHCQTSTKGLQPGQIEVQAINPFKPGSLPYLAVQLWLTPECTCGGVGHGRHWAHCNKVKHVGELENLIKELAVQAEYRANLQREMLAELKIVDPARIEETLD